MIYSISGEQPFQVNSDSFSVSPSESGYDLYLSADGVNYSNFATVAANTTRQFTSMNNGNYYILSGNTSEVKVNWDRECHGGGGGGGTAGVSSLDGQTGALTLKTVNGNELVGSGDIEISGGSGGGDYVVVKALSAITNPVDGMIAYVPSNIATYTGWEIANNVQEGYVAKVYDSGQTNELASIYRSGDDYYWGWENDGNWHEWKSGDVKALYRKNSNNDYFDIVFEDASLVHLSLEDQGASTTNISQTANTKPVYYSYDGTSWNEIELIARVFKLDSMTQEELLAAYNYLNSLEEKDRLNSAVYLDNQRLQYYGNEDNTKLLYRYLFTSSPDGFPVIYYKSVGLQSDGTIETKENKPMCASIGLTIDYTNRTMTSSPDVPAWAILRAVSNDGSWPHPSICACIRNIDPNNDTAAVSTNDVIVERTSDWGGTITVVFKYNGTTTTTVWSVWENGITLTSWS